MVIYSLIIIHIITSANQSLASARDRKASGSPDYQKAMAALMEANQRSATAKNNDDLQAALASANNAKLLADSAMAPVPVSIPQPLTTTIASKPNIATGVVLGDTARRVRHALESYFNGDFDEAVSQFHRLS